MTELPPSLSPRPAAKDVKPAPDERASDQGAQNQGAQNQGAQNQGPRIQRADHGLTAPGVAVVVLAGSLVGLLIDAFTVDSGAVFAVAFVASCLYAALQVRRSNLLAAVVLPPLVFLVLTVARALIAPESSGGASTRLLEITSDLATGAPALWAGTAVAGIVVAIRWRRGASHAPKA